MFKKRNLIFLSLLILGVLLLTGCWLIPTTTYTVTFDSQGGSAVDLQTVKDGKLLTEPTAPTKTGYTFAGWYKESGCTNAWYFTTDKVTSDITLYAKWTANTYTVTFNKNGGDTEANPRIKVVAYGGNVGTLPTPPTKTGYTFTGWNTKASGSGTDFKATTTVTANITVYAQWTGSVHNITKGTYYSTIQAALDDANTDNTIEVDDGTYDESIIFPDGKVVTLQSASGIPDNVIIQGANDSQTVTISGSSTGTTLSGFTITHNSVDTGRGIYISSGNLIIDNCTISANTSSEGGGILNGNNGILTIISSTISGNTATGNGGGGIFNIGKLTIIDSNISDNTADHKGGGIWNDNNGILTIISSTISDNTATDNGGGGIYNKGTLTINGASTISGNTTDNYGGGIYHHSGTLTITSSTISGNTVVELGGGILIYEGTVTITSSDISGNTANGGGGIFNGNNGILTITSSTISANTAAYSAGGIENSGTLTITSSTISGNTADDYGGGIYHDSGTLTITSSTISDNDATDQGGGIYLYSDVNVAIGGIDGDDTDNFNDFTNNYKTGYAPSADQHIRNSSGDCHTDYPYNSYTPN